MRFLLLILLLVICNVANLQAATKLVWDAPDPAYGITQYHVYELQADDSRKLLGSAPGGVTEFKLPPLGPGAYRFIVTAWNDRESPPSNIATLGAIPPALSIRIVIEVNVP